MTTAWDDSSAIRERLSLLASLLGWQSNNSTVKLEPGWLVEATNHYRYDPSSDSWSRDESGFGPVKVAVGEEASVQLSRLHKHGIQYHEAMRLAGYKGDDDGSLG